MNKYILVTGASRGIGQAVALAFANCGYHVFLNCNASIKQLQEVKEKIDTATPGSATLVPGNIADPDAVRAMFQTIYEHCDALDVLVNNAGVSHLGLLSDMTDEQWDRVIGTDLSSVFYCCREAIPKMVSRKSGHIINISSMWGVSGSSCEVAYSAAKSGVNGLTRALAKELAPSQIPVNAIACGVIDTVMNQWLDKEEREALEQEIPIGRFASPEEVGQLAVNLVNSPLYLTGQVIGLDGGYL